VKNDALNLLFALVASLAVGACARSSTAADVELPSIDFSDGFQQSDADAILRECHAEDIELTVHPSGEIIFLPSSNSDYDASVCVLNFIKESGTTKFGFVGNERYRTPESE
jgi:hypothetical protein